MTSTTSSRTRRFPSVGKMLTEAYRGEVDYSVRGRMSVSQSSSSVMFDGSGQPDGDRLGIPMSAKAQKHRLGLNLRSKGRQFLRTVTQESVITKSKQLKPRKSADSFKDNYVNRYWNFVKLVNEVLQRRKNYGNFRVLLSILNKMKFHRGSEHYLGLSGRLQEFENEVNCMNDFTDFQEAESIRIGNSLVTSRPVLLPPPPTPEGMVRHSFVTPSRKEGPRSIWDTHGISGNVFVNPDASSSAPYPQELHQWTSSIEEPLHSSTVEKSKRQEQNRGLRCQSGPSAKDSVIFSG